MEAPVISYDCETLGVDFYHGTKPFLVTTCDENNEITFFEWDVDPYTREVLIPIDDLAELHKLISENDLVGQNIKFDVTATSTILPHLEWPWKDTDDTLTAAHLLASNQNKDLTTLVLVYLGVNILPYEEAMRVACTEAKRVARKLGGKVTMDLFSGVSTGGSWRLAKKGLPEMPSAKDSTWKYDTWLPRAVAKHLEYPEPKSDCEHQWGLDHKCKLCGGHSWWVVTSVYANWDSTGTIGIWPVMYKLLQERGLLPLYREKMANLTVLYEMESRGTSVIEPALVAMRDEYRNDIETSSRTCKGIAKTYGHNLDIPKGSSNNKSLTTLVFDVMKLPVLRHTDGGQPSLNKDVIEEYKNVLEGRPKAFIKNLSGIRKRSKSLEYLDSYSIFGTSAPGEILVLHPSVNATATATTRSSMSNPNLQQVSRGDSMCEECLGEGCEACEYSGEDLHSVRKVFGPGPGREFWSMDAKNIELRIPAYESGEKSLIELFERPNDPPFYGSQHMLNMSIVYDDIWAAELKAVGFEKVGPHCKKKYGTGPYHWSKCGGLAMQYQCGPETADRAFHREGGYAKLKSFLGALKAHNDRCVAFAEKHGYVETIPDRSLGMKRGYPLLVSRGDFGRIIPTTPLNYRTQGSAGWWMVKAMNRCYAQLQEWKKQSGFDGYICLTVHDELVFDFPKGQGKEPWKTNLPKIARLQELMEMGGDDIGVPTPVSRSYHSNNWAEGVDV